MQKDYIWNFEDGICETNQIPLHLADDEVKLCLFSERAKTSYNKNKKDRGLRDIGCVSPTDSIECFIQETLLDSTFTNTIVISHGQKFLSLVYRALLKMTIQPVAIRKSQDLIRLISNTNNIKYINLDCYLPTLLKNLYEEDEEAVFFPHCLNHPDLFNLTLLPRNYFISVEEDSKLLTEKKEKFYIEFNKNDQTLKDLMQEYLHTELLFLSNLCLKIEETGEAFQNCLRKTEKQKELPLISVFSHVTQTSFFYAILTNYTLSFHEKFEFFTTMDPEKGVYSGATSKKEFTFQMYMKHIRKDNDLKASYLTSRPFMVGREIPDVYDSTLKQVVYYQV